MRVWVCSTEENRSLPRINHPSGLSDIIPSQPAGWNTASYRQTRTLTHTHTYACTGCGTHGHTFVFIFTSTLFTWSWQHTSCIVCNQQQRSKSTTKTAMDCQWVHTAFISFNKPKQACLYMCGDVLVLRLAVECQLKWFVPIKNIYIQTDPCSCKRVETETPFETQRNDVIQALLALYCKLAQYI